MNARTVFSLCAFILWAVTAAAQQFISGDFGQEGVTNFSMNGSNTLGSVGQQVAGGRPALVSTPVPIRPGGIPDFTQPLGQGFVSDVLPPSNFNGQTTVFNPGVGVTTTMPLPPTPLATINGTIVNPGGGTSTLNATITSPFNNELISFNGAGFISGPLGTTMLGSSDFGSGLNTGGLPSVVVGGSLPVNLGFDNTGQFLGASSAFGGFGLGGGLEGIGTTFVTGGNLLPGLGGTVPGAWPLTPYFPGPTGFFGPFSSAFGSGLPTFSGVAGFGDSFALGSFGGPATVQFGPPEFVGVAGRIINTQAPAAPAASAVPGAVAEPATLALLGIGAGLSALLRRRRVQQTHQ